MKKVVIWGIPLLVIAGVMIAFAMLEARRVPDWQAALGLYTGEAQQAGESIVVQAVVEASQPRNFSASMGRAVPLGWTWKIEQLPYPPTALRCLLVERVGGAGETKRQVLFVAYHDDRLWHAGWLVHEGPQEPFGPAAVADLDKIGCVLALP